MFAELCNFAQEKTIKVKDMIHTEALVVGAGPAGSVCGYLLQKAGIPCILIDRATFPRDKLCGGGLTPKCWKLLQELLPDFKYDYNSVRTIRFTMEGKHHCEFSLDSELRIVKRKAFDNQLLQMFISAGGTYQQDAFLSYEERADDVVVTLRSGQQIACHYLVGADGANSRIRHQLKGHRDRGLLILEQYVEPSKDNAIEIEVSRQYDNHGYYYRFPNGEFDAVGYGDDTSTPERFRQVLREKNIPETKLRGCYIYLKNDYPLRDRIILIGDAGGFANRVTSEGIKAAFVTARNAAEAIRTHRPFSEVNASMFERMKKHDLICRFFYHPVSIWLLGQLCRWPSILKRHFERGINP